MMKKGRRGRRREGKNGEEKEGREGGLDKGSIGYSSTPFVFIFFFLWRG